MIGNIKPSALTIRDLLTNEAKNGIVVPEYQRIYQWGYKECDELWNDIFEFIKNYNECQDDNAYFLGSLIVFRNSEKNLEIIDGQQRLTTFTILIRALLTYFDEAKIPNEKQLQGYKKVLQKCIWHYDEGSEEVDYKKVHLHSKVALDNELDDLRDILSEKPNINNKIQEYSKPKILEGLSKYVQNYIFFYSKIKELIPTDIEPFVRTLLATGNDKMSKLYILLVECDDMESSMTLFNTLNNRGKPLSNADIIKGLIYRKSDDREKFANQWKELGEKTKDIANDGLDFLFNRYMHYQVAKIKEGTKKLAVLSFYTQQHKEILDKADYLMDELNKLAKFWDGCIKNEEDGTLGSQEVYKFLDVLRCYPNAEYQNLLTCGFFAEKFESDDVALPFLKKLIANLGVLYVEHRGITKIRDEVSKSNVAILHNNKEMFANSQCRTILQRPDFKEKFLSANNMNRFFLCLYMHLAYKQEKDICNRKPEIEHIMPKKWENNYAGLKKEDMWLLDSIGNKTFLEKAENIRARNNYFNTKKGPYAKSKFKDANELAKYPKDDWIQEDIEKRNKEIYEIIYKFFDENL